MHPLAVACHIQPGFILMDHGTRDQGLFDVLLNLGQIAGASLHQVAQRAFAHRDGQQVLHHLAGASQGKQLLLHQIDRHGRNPGAILHGRTHLCGKGGDGDLLALRTLFLLAVMLPYQQTGWWHIHHLPPLHHAGGICLRSAWHCSQRSTGCTITSSGQGENSSVLPRWPS